MTRERALAGLALGLVPVVVLVLVALVFAPPGPLGGFGAATSEAAFAPTTSSGPGSASPGASSSIASQLPTASGVVVAVAPVTGIGGLPAPTRGPAGNSEPGGPATPPPTRPPGPAA